MQEALKNEEPVVTLRQVFEEYITYRHLKQKTLDNYRQRVHGQLSDWLDIPINLITKDMVQKKHREIKGDAMANYTMRTLRALLSFAACRYERNDGSPLIKINPTVRLTELRCWNPDKTRRNVLTSLQLAPWFKAVLSLENTTFRDFLVILVLTGMRKSEALNLKWSQVNLDEGVIYLKETKNGSDFNVALTDYAWQTLRNRKAVSNSAFVFSSQIVDGPINPGTKCMTSVIKRSGIKFCLHDLRRTYATVADDCEIEHSIRKDLMNHCNSDVTAKYTVRSTERLRRASQIITDKILGHAGIKKLALTVEVTAVRKYRLAHRFCSYSMITAGDLACKVANERAQGDKQILEEEFLRILEPIADAPEAKFFIEEVLTH